MRVPCLAVALGFLLPVSSLPADMHLRFVRLTLAEGAVTIEQPQSGERIPAERNLPMGQGFWVETPPGGRAEIELDEGSMVRLGPAALAELSDLARLSTGQRISLVSLERGTLYATAEPVGLDAFIVVAPGLEITFLGGARVRVDAGQDTSTVAILEGRVRFSSRAAEMELPEGTTVRVDPQATDRFQLDLLKAGQFVTALPAPPPLPMAASQRRVTRVGTTRVLPVASDQTYQAGREAASPEATGPQAQIRVIGAEPPQDQPPQPPNPEEGPPPATYYNYPIVQQPPAPPPPTVYYPVYEPEVVIIDRDHPHHQDHGGPNRFAPGGQPAAPAAAAPRAPSGSPPGALPGPAAPGPVARQPLMPANPPGRLLKADPAAKSEGPERQVRPHSPEAPEDGARRR